MKSTKRATLIETAARLFAEHGYHATGIDRILAEAGVAKMTLYKHFPSKRDLIVEVLRQNSASFRDWFAREVHARGADPRGRLLAIFDALDSWFHSADFRGCVFVNASAEFGGPDDPIHRAAAEHKHAVGAFVRDLAADAGAPEPAKLAEDLMLLVEGAISLAHVAGRKSAARRAGQVAEPIIDAALRRAAA